MPVNTQHYGDNDEYSYRNLLRRMDKICHSDKSHCTVTSCACDLYWNPMLCERLVGRKGILLNENRQLKIRAACFGFLVISMFLSP